MYIYDHHDKTLLQERVQQFRRQTATYLAGDLSDEEFLPLRLQNGLYIQRLAPMLRINIPYGMVSSTQLRKLAHITRTYDKGYAHFTTRQNIQLNWPQLEEVPDILAELAEVEMHAIQSSGNCIRNITSDEFAGISSDETEDPRPWCEVLRQWSTLHPEFAFLPRKFKIAVTGSQTDRAATQVHDIGLEVIKNDGGETGFKVLVGGGLGRTPAIGSVIRDFLPAKHLLTYLDAILRVYNRYGRRDNKYKARIKILVKAWTPAVFAERVEAEWQYAKDGPATLTDAEIARARSFFSHPAYENQLLNESAPTELLPNKAYEKWRNRNVRAHKVNGYCAVFLSLKPTGVAPGDVTDSQLEAIADLADRYSFGEARVTHQQNVVLADVRVQDLPQLWQEARICGFATPNIGTLTDMICCPGGDFCSLANAKSIPIAEAIQRRFDDMDYLYDLGDLSLNISGCMNACGHHHVGNIGILGVDKKGMEFYQIQLGGSAGADAALGGVLGPSFMADEVPDVIEKILQTYVDLRIEGERFIDTQRRVGIEPFKECVYEKLLDKTGSYIENDPWQLVPEGQEIPRDGKYLLLPLSLWLEQDKTGTVDPTWGIWFDSTDEVETIGSKSSKLPCIAINFPAFMDGRGFSSARIIREHYDYQGPLRALGQIIPEQLLFLARCGFDSFAIEAERNMPDPRIYFGEFSVKYQNCVDQPEPLFRRRA